MWKWGIMVYRKNIDIYDMDIQIWTICLQSMERNKLFQRVIPPQVAIRASQTILAQILFFLSPLIPTRICTMTNSVVVSYSPVKLLLLGRTDFSIPFSAWENKWAILSFSKLTQNTEELPANYRIIGPQQVIVSHKPTHWEMSKW